MQSNRAFFILLSLLLLSSINTPLYADPQEFQVGEQTIELKRGWNIISFYVQPENMSLVNIFQELIERQEVHLIKDELGDFILPSYDFDGIGDMSIFEGYHVKVWRDTTLTVRGTIVELPIAVPLDEGWNIMGFPRQAEAPARELIESSLGDIEYMLKDEDGNFNNPEWQYYRIDTLRPGEGYQIRLSRAAELLIYDTTPPELTVNWPDTPIGAETYELTGTKEPDTTIIINNQEIQDLYEVAEWTYEVSLENEGDNDIIITVRDNSIPPNQTQEEGTIVRDTTSPNLTVNWPDIAIGAESYELTGAKETNIAIFINDQEIQDLYELEDWSYEITLENEGENQITILVRDDAVPANEAQVQGTITRDTTPPELSVNWPEAPIGAETYDFTGTKEANTTILINDQEIQDLYEVTEWTYGINLSDEGENNITVTVRDNAVPANETQSQGTVIRDTTPPDLSVNWPDTPIGAEVYELTGTKEPDTTIIINDQEIQGLYELAEWTYEVSLENEGNNQITILVRDNAVPPNVTEAQGTITRDTAPPELSVNWPDSPIGAESYELTGSKEANATILINGEEIQDLYELEDWLYEVSLENEGENNITVTVRDDAIPPNETQEQGTIIRDTAPPATPQVNNWPDRPVGDEIYVIRGTKEANTSIWIQDRDEPIIAINELEAWAYAVELSEGENVISFYAQDEVGNQSDSITGTIIYDPTLPVFTRIQYEYDDLNRLTGAYYENDAQDAQIEYEYDEVGNRELYSSENR